MRSATATSGAGATRAGGWAPSPDAICSSAKSFGASVRTSSPVERILVKRGRVVGVALVDGTELMADTVVAATHPQITFLRQLDDRELPDDFVEDLKNWQSRSGTVKVNLAISELPSFSADPGTNVQEHHGGAIELCHSVAYLEQAFIDAREGRPAARPFSDGCIPSVFDRTLCPEGTHVMSLFTQWVPHTWSEEPHTEELEAYADRIIDGYNELAPNFKQSILHRQVIGPHQMEHDYRLVGGNIFHGELSTEQLFHMRPAPGFADYTTPIKGLYQCSSATHAGGGVTGIPAYLASKRILADRKLNRLTRRTAAGRSTSPVDRVDRHRRSRAPSSRPCSTRAAPGRCCRAARTWIPRSCAGSRSTSSPVRGCASAVPAKVAEPGARMAVRIGNEGVLLVRATRASCTRSRTSAVTAATSCCRAASRTSAPRSPARTTRGSTTSTARCAPRRASIRPRASTSPSTSCSACRSTEWRGWVFVNASGNAGSFEDHIGGFDAFVAPYEPERLVVGATHEYRLEANWKLAIENYHECYHCPVIHPELCRVSPPTSGENFSAPGLAIGGSMELVDGAKTMSLTGESPLPPLPGLSEKPAA